MSKLVLMYHDIVTSNDKTSGFQNESAFQYKVLVTEFEKQIQSLADKDVEFTFDDGGVSFITLAAPILEHNGKRGIFFISTDYIDTPGFLSEDQIRELESRGHIVGSHSCSHPHDISRLTPEEIAHEWNDSIKKLEDILGHKVTIASIPNGYISDNVVQNAANCGIKHLYSSSPTTSVKSRFGMNIIGRYVIHKDMTPEYVSQIATSKSRRSKIHLRWLVLEMLKALLGRNYDKVKSEFVR